MQFDEDVVMDNSSISSNDITTNSGDENSGLSFGRDEQSPFDIVVVKSTESTSMRKSSMIISNQFGSSNISADFGQLPRTITTSEDLHANNETRGTQNPINIQEDSTINGNGLSLNSSRSSDIITELSSSLKLGPNGYVSLSSRLQLGNIEDSQTTQCLNSSNHNSATITHSLDECSGAASTRNDHHSTNGNLLANPAIISCANHSDVTYAGRNPNCPLQKISSCHVNCENNSGNYKVHTEPINDAIPSSSTIPKLTQNNSNSFMPLVGFSSAKTHSTEDTQPSYQAWFRFFMENMLTTSNTLSSKMSNMLASMYSNNTQQHTITDGNVATMTNRTSIEDACPVDLSMPIPSSIARTRQRDKQQSPVKSPKRTRSSQPIAHNVPSQPADEMTTPHKNDSIVNVTQPISSVSALYPNKGGDDGKSFQMSATEFRRKYGDRIRQAHARVLQRLRENGDINGNLKNSLISGDEITQSSSVFNMESFFNDPIDRTVDSPGGSKRANRRRIPETLVRQILEDGGDQRHESLETSTKNTAPSGAEFVSTDHRHPKIEMIQTADNEDSTKPNGERDLMEAIKAYRERRRKNNEAAKRSRDARRAKDDEIALHAAYLEQENARLRFELSHAKAEYECLKSLLAAREERTT